MLQNAREVDYLRMKTQPFKYSFLHPNCGKYYVGASSKQTVNVTMICGLSAMLCIIKKLLF